jgi:hypothetical protein
LTSLHATIDRTTASCYQQPVATRSEMLMAFDWKRLTELAIVLGVLAMFVAMFLLGLDWDRLMH